LPESASRQYGILQVGQFYTLDRLIRILRSCVRSFDSLPEAMGEGGLARVLETEAPNQWAYRIDCKMLLP